MSLLNLSAFAQAFATNVTDRWDSLYPAPRLFTVKMLEVLGYGLGKTIQQTFQEALFETQVLVTTDGSRHSQGGITESLVGKDPNNLITQAVEMPDSNYLVLFGLASSGGTQPTTMPCVVSRTPTAFTYRLATDYRVGGYTDVRYFWFAFYPTGSRGKGVGAAKLKEA